ncbi:MAG: hypothetical protein V4712_02680 [Pseudomonadota bacterium]
MSNPENFIDEVTEEVRRDRLFAAFRKYGWIGLVAVVAMVGGSAYNEWSKSRVSQRAQQFGDGVLTALDSASAAERRAGVSAVAASGGQLALQQLILASDPVEDKPGTLAALEAVAADATLPASYRDLATLRGVIVAGGDLPLDDRRTRLEGIAAAGRPYRALALEQLAYLLVEDGKPADAIAALTSLVQDQTATPSLRGRVSQMITALGGTPPEPVVQAQPDLPAGG